MKKETWDRQEKLNKKDSTAFNPEQDEELAEALGEDMDTRLLAMLKSHTVMVPDEMEIGSTIEKLGIYLDSQANYDATVQTKQSPALMQTKEAYPGAYKHFHPLKSNPFHLVRLAMQYMGKWHLLASLILYVTAFIYISGGKASNNPYTFIIALSPVPLVLGLINMLKRMQAGMQELEMSFKTTAWHFTMSKLLVVCSSNILLNIIFTVLFTGLNNGISLWRMTIYWCSPFFIVCSISILIISKVRAQLLQTISVTAWIAFTILLLTDNRLQLWLIQLNTLVYACVSIAALLLIIFEIFLLFVQKEKRGELFEAYDRKFI